MAKQPQRNSNPAVSVEYDYGSKGERRTKEFADAKQAEKFVTGKEKAGKNPVVVTANEGNKADAATADTDTAAKADIHGPTKQAKPSRPTTPGVRAMRTRPYLAGTIIAKHGLAAGVTDAMVAELDAAYGKPNPTESQFCLKNAWHAARGYTGATVD